MNSVRLAEKLGYEFDHEYVAYEVTGDASPHETTIDAIQVIIYLLTVNKIEKNLMIVQLCSK